MGKRVPFGSGPSGNVPGRAKDAARRLAEELRRRPGLSVKTDAAITFEALHVIGPDGSVFVSVYEPSEDEVLYLWPCAHPEPREGEEGCAYTDLCEVIGGPGMVTAVAALIHRRVGVLPEG